MASSLQQWESDPLFSAAEVVQDSADRVDSIFRLLLHEESLSKGYNPEARLQQSIQYHRRDLATILETAKWQLEDFEREVNSLAMADDSQERQNVIYRHRQFVRAIREQLMNVEKSMEKLSVGDSTRNNEWVNLNEQDRDGLASFLSGERPAKNAQSQDSEVDTRMLRKFLDPAGSSSITEEIGEPEAESSNMKGLGHLDPNFHLRESKLRKEGSEIGFDAPSTQENACRRDEGIWDLEANESRAKIFSKQNQLRGYYSKINPFRSLRNFIPTYGSAGSRSITKRWKDGEEQRHSQSGGDFSHAIQEVFAGIMYSCGWARNGMERYQRSSNDIRGHTHPMVVILLAMVLTLIVLGGSLTVDYLVLEAWSHTSCIVLHDTHLVSFGGKSSYLIHFNWEKYNSTYMSCKLGKGNLRTRKH